METGNHPNSLEIFTFIIADQPYGLPIGDVVTVMRAAAVYNIPASGSMIHGLLNVHGEIVPVFNSRRCFKLPLKEIEPNDYFILVNTARRQVVLVVDKIGDLIRIATADLTGLSVVFEEGTCKLSKSESVDRASVLKTDTGLVLILNVEDLVSGSLESEIQQMMLPNVKDVEVS